MERIPDYDFVDGQITEEFLVKNVYDKPSYYFKITKNTETREYTPREYLDHILEKHYCEADKKRSHRKKLILYADAEHIIRRKIYAYNLKEKGLDFSNLFEDIWLQEKRIKTYYEGRERRRNFWSGAIIALIAALIGALPQIIQEFRKEPSAKPIPTKVQIIHDTIYSKAIK